MSEWTTLGRQHPCRKAARLSDELAEIDPLVGHDVLDGHRERCPWYRAYGFCRFTRPVGKKAAKRLRREIASKERGA